MDDDPYGYGEGRFYGSLYQDLALLYWGSGDPKNAEVALNQALAHLGKPGGPFEYDEGVSSWTFQKETTPDYRNDCAQMRHDPRRDDPPRIPATALNEKTGRRLAL